MRNSLNIQHAIRRIRRYILGSYKTSSLNKKYPFHKNGHQVKFNNDIEFNKHKILTYHKIGHAGFDRYGINVNMDLFSKQVKWLKDNFDVVTIENQAEILKTSKPLSNTVVLTFDDCYQGSFLEIAEILKSFSVPGIFYVSTMGFDGAYPYMWNDYLDKLLFEVGNEKTIEDLLRSLGFRFFEVVKFSEGDKTRLKKWNFHSKSNFIHQRQLIAKVLKDEFLHANNLNKLDVLKFFCRNLEMDNDNKLLTAQYIERIKDNPYVILGGHAHNHLNMALLKPHEKSYQIRKNKDLLEFYSGKKIEHFAYPFGGKRFIDVETISLLSSLGFLTAVTTIPGAVGEDYHPFLLPRLGVRGDSELMSVLQ